MYYIYTPLVLSNPTPQVRQDPWHELCNHQSHKRQTESWQDKRNWVSVLWNDLHVTNYCKIPQISPGASFFKGSFWGAHIRRGLSMEGDLHFKIEWASLIFGSVLPFLFCFSLYLRGPFPHVSPRGSFYLEGPLNFKGGFFALPVWGAYIWRGLYMERLIFRILR